MCSNIQDVEATIEEHLATNSDHFTLSHHPSDGSQHCVKPGVAQTATALSAMSLLADPGGTFRIDAQSDGMIA